jgi:hypothetical protein
VAIARLSVQWPCSTQQPLFVLWVLYIITISQQQLQASAVRGCGQLRQLACWQLHGRALHILCLACVRDKHPCSCVCSACGGVVTKVCCGLPAA